MKKVIVASINPVKIKAAKLGFKKMFPDQEFIFEGISIPSGVKDQPLGDEETFQGAFNRAKSASEKFLKSDFWVGIEGGVEAKKDEMEAYAWVVIKSKKGLLGKSRTVSFFLPSKVSELIKQGKELGQADDIVFKRTNSKQKNGAVGILTHDIITRTKYYSEGVVLALIPFKNPKLY